MTKFLVAESKEGNIPSEEIEETSTAILLGLSAFTDSQEAVEASINQTGNVTVDIDTSDITLSSSIKKVCLATQPFDPCFYQKFWENITQFCKTCKIFHFLSICLLKIVFN